MARINFLQALKINPYDNFALSGLGNLYSALDSLIPAKQYYESALRITPDDDYVLKRIAFIYLQVHDTIRAMEIN